MVGKPTDLGPIGANLTHNVRRFRTERRLGYAELSRKLAEMGREIPPLGLRRIENGDRRVDVDDLVALALALDVSLLALLLPTDTSRLVPFGRQWDAETIWRWATGSNPLPGNENFLRFLRDSNPLTDWSKVEGEIAKEVRRLGHDQ
jgi:transcriptional regulator with XRE-family HTH domain